jgi:hypothetical protein
MFMGERSYIAPGYERRQLRGGGPENGVGALLLEPMKMRRLVGAVDLRALEVLVRELLQGVGRGGGFDDLDLTQHLARSAISQ